MISFLLTSMLSYLSLTNTNNSNFIDEHNALNLSYTVEANQFINRNYTDEYFVDPSHGHFIQKNETLHTLQLNDALPAPLQINWEKKNHVSSVKNQLRCGGCWAFSSAEAVESIWSIQNNVLYNLSEQELIDCSSSYGNNGCNGGSMDAAFQYIIQNGLCTNLSYPYQAAQNECQNNTCEAVVKITNYSDITQNQEMILKRAVALQPVSVAIQANKRSFQMYQSGIYSDPECGTQLDHGVLIVGYGHSFEDNMDYWIVKNSWGPEWGENGYIRIQRNIDDERGLCGIAMQPSIPLLH